MNSKLLIALPLFALLSLGAFFALSHKNELEMGRNKTTIFQWFSCFNEKTKAECEDLKDEGLKALCNTAAYTIGQYTFNGSPYAFKPCQQFHDFLSTAQINDQLNTENYYQDCYMNTEVLKTAYQSAYYNNTIYYPLYINCAGF